MTWRDEPQWYAVVDTAQDERLYPLVRSCRAVQCLVVGEIPLIVAATLPYLVRLDPGEPLVQNWRMMGVGQGWGIMLQTRLSMDALRLHLKKCLNAKLPDGMVVWFRFYDPAVLLTYLRSCSAEELQPWFREIDQYLIDDDTNDCQLRLFRMDGRLREMKWEGA